MTPNPFRNRCRRVFDSIVRWRRRFVLLGVIGALSSLVLVSSARFEERAGINASAPPVSSDKRLSGSKQDDTFMAGAARVDIPAVKPKIFRGDVRSLPVVKPKIKKPLREPKEPGPELPTRLGPDTALQPFAPAAPAPASTGNFQGLDFANWGAGWPPDTVGDVGPNHYIQAVNSSIGIFDKATGINIASFTFDNFFSQQPTGTPCDQDNRGDPVVLYDALSDRWIISNFAWTNFASGPMYQCMAVSQTSDPVNGGWYFYAWQTSSGGTLPDYPKLGVWPDGIYMTANVFSTAGSGSFQNVQVWAFNRTEMESGVTAHAVSFVLPKTISNVSIFSLLPSHVSSNGSQPVAGTPNYLTSIWGISRVRVWKFHVDYGVPSNSSLTGPFNVTIASFSAGPGNVPEKDGNSLDSLTYRVMMQNQYQNLNGVESLWLTHTIGSGGTPNIAQIRWYQLNVTGGSVVTSGPLQQGTWSPDSKHRFMPSLALDKDGNMAVGYSVSDATMYPAIRYAGRLASDALNTLGQGETSMIEGTGFQCCKFSDGTLNNRWGDYSAMTIDPDGCTFWYTNQYYDSLPTTLQQDNWKTRIGSFRYSQCTPNTVGTLQGTVTDASTNTGINKALVTAGIHVLKTDSSGFYRFNNLPTGSYQISVSAAGYSSGVANNVNVSAGGTTTRNFALTSTGPTPTGESPNNTRVPPASQIVDSNGSVWTRTANGTILRNGASTGGVGPQILYCNHLVYAFGTDSQWWRWTGTSWTPAGTVDPCGGSTGESANNTRVPPASQIVDSNGAVWTRTSDGTILRNGASTGGVGPQILYCNHIVYAFGTDSQWWRWTGSSWTPAGTVDPCAGSTGESPNNTRVPPAGQIVDSNGDVWTRTANGTILRNGINTGGAGPQILYCNHIVYAFGTDSQWWRWTGTSWTPAGTVDPCAGAAPTPAG